jgi:hypothetical protein
MNPAQRNTDKFFSWAIARQNILLRRREGTRPPWSSDPVFQTEYFCNVFREDDRTTKWFRENVREPMNATGDARSILLSIVAFRWFNRISTWRTLIHYAEDHEFPSLDLIHLWDSNKIKSILEMTGEAPWVTGAYIIKTPDGMTKLDGVLWCIDQFKAHMEMGAFDKILEGKASMEEACKILQRSPYLGNFMAWQICSDLRQTILLKAAKDADTWAQPGPGTARGLGRIFYNDPEHFTYGGKSSEKEMLALLQELSSMSRDPICWPSEFPFIAVIDASHICCEVDKYQRCKEGGRMKRKYNAR